MINYNVDPYYDDFDPAKNYHRILFKPGHAVQARELTQSQTILQNQISQFASSIYAQNVPISGGTVTTNLRCNYVKLNTLYNGSAIDVNQFNNITITDDPAVQSVVAQVIAVAAATGTSVNPGDPPTLIVTYLTGKQFGDGNTIYQISGTTFPAIAQTIGTSGGSTATGPSSVASIADGIFYITNGYQVTETNKFTIGNFVNISKQTVILSKYTNTPSVRLGLNITESTVSYSDDSSLLDPAIGSTNYQAPGADRYKISLTLETRVLTLGNDDTFIELIKYIDGSPILQTNQSVASTIDDYFAKRTSETNGDFIVNDFTITPVANTANSALFDLRIGKGVAYVNGYRLENSSDLIVTAPRARTTALSNNNTLFLDYGSYFYVDNVTGSANAWFDITTGPEVYLHLVPSANIVSTNTTTYNSTVYGRARVRGLVYDHNTSDANTKSYVYKSYLYDIVANSITTNASSSTANTVTFYDTTGKLTSTNNAYVGSQIVVTSGTGTGYVGQITAYNGSTKTATIANTFPNTVGVANASTSSIFTISPTINTIQSIVISNSTYAITSSMNVSSAFLQNPNKPELIYKLGNPAVASVTSGSYYSTLVFRNQPFSYSTGSSTLSLNLNTLNPAFANTITFEGGSGGSALSADAIKRNFTIVLTNAQGDSANNGANGAIMDFCSSGNTVTISVDSSTVTFTSTKYTSFTATIYARVNVLNADSAILLKTKTLISGNTSQVDLSGPDSSGASLTDGNTFVSTANGQVYIQNAGIKTSPGLIQSLYVSDVKNIVKIIDTGSPSIVPTVAILANPAYDITTSYNFNNGQKDTHYGHAYLTLNPGAPVPRGNILVVFNYYNTSGGDGYYSYMSYVNENYVQIPSYTSSHGTTYNLRDCLDFRPRRKDGTANVVYQTSTTVTSTNFAGYLIPQDQTNWNSNYSYYLGRKDKLVLSKDKSFQSIQGNPALNPILPTEPNGSLLIANLTLDPYTAYLPSEAPNGILPNLSLQKVSHRRWTMADISDLQTQVNNLEYYASLNALEQSALATQVTDVNGLNRFKNGILVDDFSSFGTVDTGNPNFNASIDTATKRLSAAQKVTNYPLQSTVVYETLGNSANTSSTLGYQIHSMGKTTTNYFSLPYSSTPIITQQLASNTVNLNPFTTPVFQGMMNLNPPMDNWVDNTQAPDLLIVDPNLQIYQQSNTLNVLNVTNWQTIPGTQYTVNGGTTYTVGHNINASPYGFVGYSTTTLNNFASQTQQSTLGYWSNLGSTYTQNNGYITNVSIQPYIRPQQLVFKASSLKINTPLSTWFDGVNVDQYITNPDIIELSGVTGTFKPNDILGYYDTNQLEFYPIASVVSTYVYPANTANVRLYITSNFHTGHRMVGITSETQTNILSNSVFDNNGNYVSNTAFGIVSNSLAVTFNNQGYISSVGGTFTDALNTNVTLFRKVISGYGEFMNAYAVWHNQDVTSYHPDGTNAFDVTFNVYFPYTGNYYLQFGYDEQGILYLDGTQIGGVSNINQENESTGDLITRSITAGYHTIRIYVKQYSASDAQAALAISTAPWAAASSASTNGTVIFNTANPSGYTPSYVSQAYGMPSGGVYFTGVTKVALNPSSNTTNNYYTGATINFVTSYVSQDAGKNPKVTQQYYSSTITSYDGATHIATLGTAVNLSMGLNLGVGGLVTSTYSISGTQYNYAAAIKNGAPAQLSSNEKGEFVGIFNIPQGKFQTGTRVFRVDNRTTAADPTSATTWAESTFTASGLSTTSQNIDFAPSIVGATNTFTRTQYRDNVLINTSYVVNPWDPVAQSFIIDKANYPYGAFLTSLRVFFKSKPQNTSSGVTLSIVNTLNGYPNGKTLDNSMVTLTPDVIKVSDTPQYLDANTYTEFTFSAPVYIQPNVLYAFILQSQSTEYNLWIAAQNATALASSVKNQPTDPDPSSITKIGTSPYVGSLFESQNSITWTADQTKAMMFVANAAYFDITQNPKIAFTIPKGLPQRKLTTQDIQKYYSTNLISNLNGIVTTQDVPSDAYNITTTDFVPTATSLSYSYQSLVNNSKTFDAEKSVIPGKYGSPTHQNIYLNDNSGQRVLQANNTATFSLFGTMSSTNRYVSPFISDDGLSLYNIQYTINNMGITNSAITLVSGGTRYTQANTTVTFSTPDVSGGVQAQASANVVNGVVQNIYITNTGSGYLNTPTISIVDTTSKVASGFVTSNLSSNVISGIGTSFTAQFNTNTSLVTTEGITIGTITSIANSTSLTLSQANAYISLTNVAVIATNTSISASASGATANAVSEYSPTGGNALSKYITKKVTLTSTNTSKDLRVFFTAYRPQNTNIYVFYRVQAASDNQVFENGSWQLMTYVNNTGNAYSTSISDMKEYELAPGVGGTANGSIQYVSTNGSTYKDFTQFAIKLVMTSSDSTFVPFVNNLQVLALPSNTGL